MSAKAIGPSRFFVVDRQVPEPNADTVRPDTGLLDRVAYQYFMMRVSTTVSVCHLLGCWATALVVVLSFNRTQAMRSTFSQPALP